MAGPERIHIVMGAAATTVRFDEMGLHHTFRNPPTPEQITGMLGRQVGRLFALPGFTDEPCGHVSLQVHEVREDEVLWVHNRLEPPFEGEYIVAAVTAADD